MMLLLLMLLLQSAVTLMTGAGVLVATCPS
jgi:hypothetical protein